MTINNIDFYTFTMKDEKLFKLVLKAAPFVQFDEIITVLLEGILNVQCIELKSLETSTAKTRNQTAGKTTKKKTWKDKLTIEILRCWDRNEPTHSAANRGKDILDIALAKNITVNIESQVIRDLNSDHYPVVIKIAKSKIGSGNKTIIFNPDKFKK